MDSSNATESSNSIINDTHIINEDFFTIALKVDNVSYDSILNRYIISLPKSSFTFKNDTQNALNIEISDASRVLSVTKNIEIGEEKEITIEEEKQCPKHMSTHPMINESHLQKRLQYIDKYLSTTDKYFLLFWMLYFMFAIIFYMYLEDMSFINSLYFRIVTAFNVGYGDFYAKTNIGISLNCIFMIVDGLKLAYIDCRIMLGIFRYRKQATNTVMRNLNQNEFLFFCTVLCILLCVIIGTMIMSTLEEYNTLEAFQWSIATLTTVGYGDVVPRTVFGKAFCIIFICFGYLLQLYVAVVVFEILMITKFNAMLTRNSGSPLSHIIQNVTGNTTEMVQLLQEE